MEGRTNKDIAYFAFISVVITGVLSFVLMNEFVWDDIYVIKDYERLGKPSSLVTALTKTYWNNTAYQAEQLTNLYRPGTSLILAVVGVIFGKAKAAFHGLSLIALLCAAFALARLVTRIISVGARMIVAFTVAALFVIHPLSIETTCMVANVSDHLALCFLLLTITASLDYLNGMRGSRTIVTIVLCSFLASASKEFGVISACSPFIAYSLLAGRSERPPFGTLRSAALWLSAIVPVALYITLRLLVIHDSGSDEFFFNSSSAFSFDVVAIGIGRALLHSIAPIPTGAHVYVDPRSIISWIPFAIYLLILGVVIFWNRRRGLLFSIPLVGLVLAFVLLLPSMLIISEYMIGYRYPTRYFHLPLAGFLISLSPLLAAKWHSGIRNIASVVLSLLALLSWVRINEWRNEISFSQAEARYHEDSALELENLALAYLNAKIFDKAESAIQALEKAPDITNPRHSARALFLRSELAFHRDGDIEKGTAFLERSLSVKPDHLGHVYALARLRALDNRPDQSIIILERALAAPWFSQSQKKDINRRLGLIKSHLYNPSFRVRQRLTEP